MLPKALVNMLLRAECCYGEIPQQGSYPELIHGGRINLGLKSPTHTKRVTTLGKATDSPLIQKKRLMFESFYLQTVALGSRGCPGVCS